MKRLMMVAALLLAGCAGTPAPQPTATAVVAAAPGGQQAASFAFKGATLRYLISMPARTDPARALPLLLNLHGSEHIGPDLARLRRDGTLPELLDKPNLLGVVVVSPQLERGDWEAQFEALGALVDELIKRHNLDPDRVYLTGWGSGGDAAWQLAAAQPQRWAALIPVASRMPLGRDALCKLAHLPVFAMHGAADTEIPGERAQLQTLQFRDCGGNILMRMFDRAPHEVWRIGYANNEWSDWMLFRVRPKRAG